jgi:hypothetical protein
MPPLAPTGAGSATPSIAPAESSLEPSSRWTPLGRAAEPHDRQRLHLNQAHEPVAGESLVLLPTFPGQGRRRSRPIPASRAGHRPGGLHCKAPNTSEGLSANQGHFCKES